MKEVGLYIHIPFCMKKCLYCDFNSYEGRERDGEAYEKALIEEIEMYRRKFDLTYKTVFIGGGTPTVIDYFLIGSVMEKVMPYVVPDGEISMECNPGTVTHDSLKYYRSIGINRLSIGLQAWQDSLLKKIGRIHSVDDFLKTYENARKAGFANINADVMFALPGQTMDMWQETVKNICRLGVEHISCYSLKLEEGTKLYEMSEKGLIALPDEDLDREMYDYAVRSFEECGYRQYEISNFAKPGFQCRHNLIYWHNEEYIGAGAGSHSKLNGRRFWNTGDIKGYIDKVEEGGLPVEGEETLSRKEDMWETIFLALRLNEGLDIKVFEAEYNVNFKEKYRYQLKKLSDSGLIQIVDSRLMLTKKGRDLANMVFMEFM